MAPETLQELFERLAKESFCPELIGDTLLVRVLPPRENKTKSGLVIPTLAKAQVDGVEANRPCWVEILLTGKGFYDDETGEDVPLYVKPGNIVLVGKLAVSNLSSFGPIVCEAHTQLAIARQSEVRMVNSGLRSYLAMENFLAEALDLRA